MFVRNVPKEPKGLKLQSTVPGDRMVERALLAAGLPYQLVGHPNTVDMVNGRPVHADFTLPTVGIVIEVRDDCDRAKPGDLIYDGETGLHDLTTLFEGLARAAA